MNCVLFRHGIAVEREEWDGPDTDRPLTERGTKRVTQVAGGLKWLEVQPTYIFSSPLVRALETADILQASLTIPSAVKRVEELLPDANPERLLALFRDLPPEACVLCVGHEPHLGTLAYWLLSGEAVGGRIAMKKGGACLLELDPRSRTPKATLLWSLTPSLLRRLSD